MRGDRVRAIAFGAATALIVFTTPWVRGLAWLARLPDAVQGYIRPIPGLTNFTIFPWAAFVTAGVVVGLLLDKARTPRSDRLTNLGLGLAGVTLALVARRASFLPPLDSRSAFWTTSASFFFIRLGVMIAALTAAYLWEQRPGAGKRWSPLQTLGRSSLFIYWIHVEMVYGLVSLPLHHAFSLVGAWMALFLFCLFMVACAAAKDRFLKWWKDGTISPDRSFAYAGSSAGAVKP